MLKRIILAVAAGLCTVLVLTPPWIKYLKRLDYGQIIRSQGPKRHQIKSGTPTMGGVVIVIAIVAAALLVADWTSEVLLSVALTVTYALIGLEDDWRKTVKKRSLGLRAREKLIFQIIPAAIMGSWIYLQGGSGTEIYIPVYGAVQLGLWYVVFAVLIAVSTANAVNLTDGLDGLAAGTVFIALLAFTVIAWEQQSVLAIFTAGAAGACLGFLWFNGYPARIFMGDTGSLALGAVLATAAIFTKTELFLIIIGGIFVLEALSTIIQVLFFRLTGGRIFRMSPLHHHFELLGWSEPVVVRRFWLASTAMSVLGLTIWYHFVVL